jgi:hypothetical protein
MRSAEPWCPSTKKRRWATGSWCVSKIRRWLSNVQPCDSAERWCALERTFAQLDGARVHVVRAAARREDSLALLDAALMSSFFAPGDDRQGSGAHAGRTGAGSSARCICSTEWRQCSSSRAACATAAVSRSIEAVARSAGRFAVLVARFRRPHAHSRTIAARRNCASPNFGMLEAASGMHNESMSPHVI